jgi:acyl-CoA thioesterase I
MSDTAQTTQLNNIVNRLHSGDTVRIVGLGDSLTHGWEASFSYFDLFISRLRTEFNSATVNGINAGICGDTARGGVTRVGRLLEEKTDLLLVQFGINDLYCGVSIDSYADALGAIAQKTIQSGSLPLLVTSGPLLYPEQQREIAPYYNALHRVAANLQCPTADIASYWRTQFTTFSHFYYEDGVHPNDAGYRAMADALYTLSISPSLPA